MAAVRILHHVVFAEALTTPAGICSFTLNQQQLRGTRFSGTTSFPAIDFRVGSQIEDTVLAFAIGIVFILV